MTASWAMLGRCKGCKAGYRVAVDFDSDGEPTPSTPLAHFNHNALTAHLRCGCGRLVAVRKLHGTLNTTKVCNASCMNAASASCDCSCGGANHGGKWS